ncbi:MAG: response regulator [Lachnospiraceae bacterium]|nr:response regulator [Lachnospiraceae bacterium]
MNDKKINMTGVTKWMFAILTMIVFVWFLLGELVLPREIEANTEQCEVFESDWSRVMPDGSIIPIEVPGKCDAEGWEAVSIETILPDKIEDKTWLCFRSSQQDMEIYIDQILRERYNTENSKPFGKTSMSAYIFVELMREDAGKTIKVVTTSDSAYAGVINSIYIGEKWGIWQFLLGQYGLPLAAACLLFVLGLVAAGISMAIRICYDKNVMLEYLGWGIFLAAVWLICESRLKQWIFPNISVVGALGFFTIMLLPFPFLIYVNALQQYRYAKYYHAMNAVGICNFLLCTFLQVTNQKDFLETMFLMHTWIVMAILLATVTICVDIKKKYIQEYYQVALGVTGMMVAAIMEIVLVYTNNGHSSGLMLCVGLLFLLVMASIKTGRDLLAMEYEKKRALFASESKTQFLANMSHEIRTPINSIMGMNEMISRESKEAEIIGYSDNIKRSSKMLLSLVDDILDFSEMESGKLKILESEYEVMPLFEDLGYALQDGAGKKGLAVEVHVDDRLPSVLSGDERRIRQIVLNLISNAVKYTKEGTIILKAEAFFAEGEQLTLLISVTDTGIGIQEENLEKLFESFSRLEMNKNRTLQGTGLGLSITKRLVENMQGEITVHSVYGQGSQFTVRIPQKITSQITIGELTKMKENSPEATLCQKSILKAPEASVLAVDDNEMNITVVKGLLKRTEIQLDTALGGEECLALCREKKYDLIFMDHMMPEPDGIETLHRLRAEFGNPNQNTKVVVLTANAVAGSKEEYLKVGFEDYLSKPLDVLELEHILETHLPKELVYREVLTELAAGELSITGDSVLEKEAAISSDINTLIDKNIGLNYCAGNEEMYFEIARAYFEQAQKYKKELPEYYERKEWNEYKVIVHAMKSTSLTIGATDFSNRAKQHEMAAKEGNETFIVADWEGFLQNYEDVLRELTNILSTDKKLELEQKEISRTQYLEECHSLLKLIQAYSMNEAIEQVDALQGFYVKGCTVPIVEVLESVRKAVDDFDYDRAEELVTELIDKLQEE